MDPKSKRKRRHSSSTVQLASVQPDLLHRMQEETVDSPCLVVLTGRQAGHILRLDGTCFTLGRSGDCDLTLPDDSISRQHARIDRVTGGHVLIDLDSCNGVWVDGARTRERRLKVGDKLLLGHFTLVEYTSKNELELEVQERLLSAVSTDALTGALNRHGLDLRLRDEWAFAVRHGTSLSVLMVDVDHFKRVNDTWGHAAGDEVLRQVAATLQTTIRAEDDLGRYGGEEFVVLARGIRHVDAGALARRLRAMVSELAVEHGTTRVDVRISIGFATWDHDDVGSPAELLERADARLYIAKTTGRNREVGEG